MVCPGVSQHELQSDLQMTATCIGLGGAQVSPKLQTKVAATSAEHEAT